MYYLRYVRHIVVSLLKQVNKGPLMNSCEQFHIHLKMTKYYIHFITFKNCLYIFIFLSLYFPVHNNVHYIFYTKEFPAVPLHARDQYIKQLFYTI
jgi:transposase